MKKWLIACFIGVLPLRPATCPTRLEVHVDTRVELAAVLCRLAGFPEYQTHGVPQYDRAVDAYFQSYRNHPSVQVLRELRARRPFAYNVPVSFGLCATPRTWKLGVEPANGLVDDPDWNAGDARVFLDACSRFSRDTHAAAFFASQRGFYHRAERQIREQLLQHMDLPWFQRYFGHHTRARFSIVLGLMDGQNSYDAHLNRGHGQEEIVVLLATPSLEHDTPANHPLGARFPVAQALGLVIHELCHTWVNPWVADHAAELEPAAQGLFQRIKETMKQDAYGELRDMLDESLVRASTLCYLDDHGQTKAFAAMQTEDRDQGFPWTPELEGILQNAAEPRLDRAEPEIVAFFQLRSANPGGRIKTRSTQSRPD